MNLKEFDNFSMGDAIHFHEHLNPAIFKGDMMRQEVRTQLLLIAEDFIEHLGVNHIDVEDITISGSSAAYSYTKHSDIDLHIIVDMSKFSDNDVYRELFDAKKVVYNESHDISIGGYEVELYVQDSNMPVISLGEYSVKDDKWIKLPRKRRANLDQQATKLKYEKLYKLSEYAYKSNSIDKLQNVLRTIKKYRQAGLDLNGEFGPENLAYKALRSKGIVSKLYQKLDELHSKRLSLPEDDEHLDKPTMTVAELARKHKVNRQQIQDELSKGIKVELEHTGKFKIAKEIALDHLGEDPEYYTKLADVELEEGWKEKLAGGALAAGMAMAPGHANAMDWKDAAMTGAMFVPGIGQAVKAYNVGSNLYQAAKAGKQLYDLKKDTTTQQAIQPTKNIGSSDEIDSTDDWEEIKEASGYIPSEKEKNDPRWKTALTVDVKPNSIKNNAKAFGFKVSRAGIPPSLR